MLEWIHVLSCNKCLQHLFTNSTKVAPAVFSFFSIGKFKQALNSLIKGKVTKLIVKQGISNLHGILKTNILTHICGREEPLIT